MIISLTDGCDGRLMQRGIGGSGYMFSCSRANECQALTRWKPFINDIEMLPWLATGRIAAVDLIK